MRPLDGPLSWAGCAERPAVALAVSTPVADAAFFDLDKTIIAGSSALAFSRPFLREGLISRRAVLRSGYAQLLLLVAGADASTMDRLRERITALCAGWDVAQVRAVVAQTLHEIVEPLVYAEAQALIAEHRAQGDEIVVLSASGQEVVEPIAAMVGADRCLATRMAVADGRYTGEIELLLLRRAKAEAARAIAAERGYDLARLPRVLRLDHRSAVALRGRVPHGGQPGPGPAAGRAGARLAGADLRPAGRAAHANCAGGRAGRARGDGGARAALRSARRRFDHPPTA